MTPEHLTTLFAWMTLLNIGVLLLAGFAILLLKDWMASIHATMMGISEQEVTSLYFRWLASYKRLTLMFFLVPYIAMRIAL